MENKMNIADRMAGLVVAAALVVVGAGFIVLGVSFFPVVGIFVGLAMLGLAWSFISPKAMVFERIAGFLIPNNVMFHLGHGWARMEKNDTITVGMDDFAVKLLGSADSISLPKLGSRVKQGSSGWWFKTDSQVIHMQSPVEGEIVAVNSEVVDSPALAFGDPYGKGWLLKVTNGEPAANRENMIPQAMVRPWLENIREALCCRRPGMAMAGFCQDGGEPVSGLAKAVDPQGWLDLAREFLLTK
jgi:glycine cleavage system H lipoate-binding protein